jgi:hypothetical protein
MPFVILCPNFNRTLHTLIYGITVWGIRILTFNHWFSSDSLWPVAVLLQTSRSQQSHYSEPVGLRGQHVIVEEWSATECWQLHGLPSLGMFVDVRDYKYERGWVFRQYGLQLCGICSQLLTLNPLRVYGQPDHQYQEAQYREESKIYLGHSCSLNRS